MVEPQRKKPPASSTVRQVYPTKTPRSLVLVTTHPVRPGELDLRSLRDGDPRPANRQWKGPINGRPILIAQLMPAIRAQYYDAPNKTTVRVRQLLRLYWRLFDRHAGIAPVQGVADINDLHGAIQLREGVDRADTQAFLLLVNDARAALGLPRLFWPVKEDQPGTADLPARAHVARVYKFLKQRAYQAIDRIERALREQADPTPSLAEVWHLFLLFLLRSGWNRQTAMDLDTGSCLLPHPTSAAHHVVRAIKLRGNTEQIAIGLEKSALSPGNIVRLLVKATAPLREQVQRQLDKLGPVPATGESDARRLQRAKLEALLRTPWLFPGRFVATTLTEGLRLKPILQEINASLPPEQHVSESITVGDLRDAYIAFAYEYSGYSWIVAKVAAGHKSLESLKAYLRQRQWKAHGERKVLRFGDALWSLVTERRVVDAAVLHAMVENREVSQEQVDRWLARKDRTRLGTACKDFKHPPSYIAPNHVSNTGCRIQRCALCTHAILFNDSVDLLARRVAELMALKERIPLATWLESSFPDELEATEKHLERFEPASVRERMEHWRRAIATGQHRIVHLEGSYGAA